MRRNIKISISLILIVVLLLAFTGCGPIETDASTGSETGTSDTKTERSTFYRCWSG